MGDRETVVTETPVAVVTYNSDGYGNTTQNPVPEAGATAAETTEEAAHANLYGRDPNSMLQHAQFNMTDDSKQALRATDTDETTSGLGNTAAESSQVSDYNSSGNGSVVGAAVNESGLENGNALENIDGLAEEKQAADGYAASAMSVEEEDRLWSIVTANSLDFNAWTALIAETEKAAEHNIFKIRRVYDSFLAEFPLCYGYWKKYADHEARLGSIDKVVEVYEHAIQGVTYSVDMWLHYCIFAISTYGDPDTVRRMPATAIPPFYRGKL